MSLFYLFTNYVSFNQTFYLMGLGGFFAGREKETAGIFFSLKQWRCFFEDKSSVTHKVVYKIEARVSIRKRE